MPDRSWPPPTSKIQHKGGIAGLERECTTRRRPVAFRLVDGKMEQSISTALVKHRRRPNPEEARVLSDNISSARPGESLAGNRALSLKQGQVDQRNVYRLCPLRRRADPAERQMLECTELMRNATSTKRPGVCPFIGRPTRKSHAGLPRGHGSLTERMAKSGYRDSTSLSSGPASCRRPARTSWLLPSPHAAVRGMVEETVTRRLAKASGSDQKIA